MCLIYYSQAGKFDLANLKEANHRNDDGFGIAVWIGEKWETGTKFPNPNDDDLETLLKKYEGLPFAVHFRISTGGAKDKANCHPFELGSGWRLMHNGTLECHASKEKSDTNIFAEFVRDNEIAKNVDQLVKLCDWVRNGSRLLLLSPNGPEKSIRLGNWTDRAEGSYSNSMNFCAPRYTSRITYCGDGNISNIQYVGEERIKAHWSNEHKCYMGLEGQHKGLAGVYCTARREYIWCKPKNIAKVRARSEKLWARQRDVDRANRNKSAKFVNTSTMDDFRRQEDFDIPLTSDLDELIDAETRLADHNRYRKPFDWEG